MKMKKRKGGGEARKMWVNWRMIFRTVGVPSGDVWCLDVNINRDNEGGGKKGKTPLLVEAGMRQLKWENKRQNGSEVDSIKKPTSLVVE